MIAELYEDNNKILELWKQAFKVAEQEDQQGICDFIASRIDAHGKHNWMLRSILKKSRA
jgi:DNA-binding ferritin-like protein